MKKLMLAAFFITGCGSNITVDNVQRIDKVNHRSPIIEDEFKPHVKKFNELYNQEVRMLIEWGDLDEKVMGTCYYWSDGYREIKIDRTKWKYLSDLGQEQLIFHELGHCQFNLDHNDEIISFGDWTHIPKSTMYPYAFGDTDYYADNQEYYMEELYTVGLRR